MHNFKPLALDFRPPPEWFQADNRFGILGSIRVFLPLILLLTAAPYAVESISPYVVLVFAPLIGAFAHKLTIIMHDCSHLVLFRSRRLNVFVGRLAGAILGSDLDTFTRIHWHHHRVQGQPDDPQGKDYLLARNISKKKLWLRLLSPLWGGDLFKLALFNVYTAKATRNSEKVGSAEDQCDKVWQKLKYPSIITSQGVIALLATGLGTNQWLVLLYPLSAATFGLFFSKIRSIAEHIPAGDAKLESHVRTHLPNIVDSMFIFDLNFNFHVEHHLYPGVASKFLPLLHRQLQEQDFFNSESLSPHVIATLRRRLQQTA